MWSSVIDLIVLSPSREKMRICGTEWEYCNGDCACCHKQNLEHSTGTKEIERKDNEISRY